MRSTAKCPFDARFLRYQFGRTWSTALVWAIVSVVFSLGSLAVNYLSDLFSGGVIAVLAETVLDTPATLAVPFLFVLAAKMFGIFFRRSSTDFAGSLPVSRVSMALTSLGLGFAYILAMGLLTAGLSALMYNGAGWLAFGELARYFAFYVAGSAVVFALFCLAATLSGTALGMLVLSFCFVVGVPLLISGLSNAVRSLLPYTADSAVLCCKIDTLMPLSVHSRLDNLPRGAYDVAVCTLYNLVLAVGYSALTALSLRARALETAERHYKNERVTDVVMVCAAVPLLFAVETLMLGIGGAIADEHFSAVVTVLLEVLSVVLAVLVGGFILYGVFGVVMRRGFRKFGHTAVSYFVALGVSAALCFGCVAASFLCRQTVTREELRDAKSVTVQISTAEAYDIYGTERYTVPYTFDDPRLIALFAEECRSATIDGVFSFDVMDYDSDVTQNSAKTATVTLADGRVREVYYAPAMLDARLTANGLLPLRENVKNNGDFDTGTYGAAEFVTSNGSRTVLNAKTLQPYLDELRAQKRALPKADREALYDAIEFNDWFKAINLPYEVPFAAAVYTYRDGTYYVEILPVAEGSDAFNASMDDMAAQVKRQLSGKMLFEPTVYISLPDGSSRYDEVWYILQPYAVDIARDLANAYPNLDDGEHDLFTVEINGASYVLYGDADTVFAPYFERYADDLAEMVQSLQGSQLGSVNADSPDFSMNLWCGENNDDLLDRVPGLLRAALDDNLRALREGRLPEGEDLVSVSFWLNTLFEDRYLWLDAGDADVKAFLDDCEHRGCLRRYDENGRMLDSAWIYTPEGENLYLSSYSTPRELKHLQKILSDGGEPQGVSVSVTADYTTREGRYLCEEYKLTLSEATLKLFSDAAKGEIYPVYD